MEQLPLFNEEDLPPMRVDVIGDTLVFQRITVNPRGPSVGFSVELVDLEEEESSEDSPPDGLM